MRKDFLLCQTALRTLSLCICTYVYLYKVEQTYGVTIYETKMLLQQFFVQLTVTAVWKISILKVILYIITSLH